uniref:Cytochrome c oxidase subunit 3 n=1 Tax=Juglanconis sp. TaxID=2041886 RepID=A0A291LII7_9PEZI|nr:cytochrome c oxidase subunit 3 [Juglanconis sp.]
MTNLIRSNFQDHPFHLVSPSPWPLYTSICLLNLTTSAALSMHNFSNSYYIYYIALLLLVSAMSFWFRDIISEATYLGDHTLAVQKGLNLGVILFIVSEALFFVAIFWAFFHSALTPTVELGAMWPPIGIEPVNPFELPLLNTVILLSSGATVTWAHHSLIEGERIGSLYGSVATVLLAVVFTMFQGIEYNVSSFTISDGAFGTCFFFGTGFHYIFFCIIYYHYSSIIPMVACGGLSNAYILPKEDKGFAHPRRGLGKFKNTFINLSVQTLCLGTGAGSKDKRQYSTAVIGLSGLKKESKLPPYWVTGFADAESSFSLKVSKKSTSKIGWLAQKRLYSTEQRELLNPYWVTGFADAESSFSLRVSKKRTSKSGWGVTPQFRINLHIRDLLLLRKIHFFFGVGIIYEWEKSNTVTYMVQSLRDITNVIIPHFDKYPLLTQKRADYLLFRQGVNLLNLKVHSEIEGVRQILSIKASMNREGLSDTLRMNFSTVLPVSRPVVRFEGIGNPNWLAGFADGEGFFYVGVLNSKTILSGFSVSLEFSVSQHVRDELLLSKFAEYLECGKISKASARPNSVTFVVRKFSDIKEKVIPFFQRFPLHGIKSMDYRYFCEVAKIMEDKSHLTLEGLKKIKSLKSGLNKGRISD